MLEKVNQLHYEATCNKCNFHKIYPAAEHTILDKIESEGWRTYREDMMWKHSCPQCEANHD